MPCSVILSNIQAQRNYQMALQVRTIIFNCPSKLITFLWFQLSWVSVSFLSSFSALVSIFLFNIRVKT